MNELKKRIKRNKLIIKLINMLSLKKKINGCNNKLNILSLLYKSDVMINGNDNQIILGKTNTKSCIHINVYGSNNIIKVCDNVTNVNTTLWIEGDNNLIEIGEGCALTGSIQISAIEGTSVIIGKDCLFSSGIDIRTGDGHSVLDINGNRINASKNIILKNHIWIGKDVCIGKGVSISDNCIVSMRSVVTKEFSKPNSVIAGVPASIVKNDVNWSFDRI